jgi:hypothetical protein
MLCSTSDRCHHDEAIPEVGAEALNVKTSCSINSFGTITSETVVDDSSHIGEVVHCSPQCEEAVNNPSKVIANLDPPLGRIEQARDRLLRILDGSWFQVVGLGVLLLVVIDGAFFFFLLVGWHNMCDEPSKINCSPRNYWYNWSIQILTFLFTFMSLVSMPWRCANFLHLTCPTRTNAVGHNLHGLADSEVWFHIPLSRRLGITILLLCNALFQFMNQATRIFFADYSSQATMQGMVWTNFFCFSSLLSGAVAIGWILWESGQLRQADPGKFGLGPIDHLKQAFYRTRKDMEGTTVEGALERDDVEAQGLEANNGEDSSELEYVDPTQSRNHVVLLGDKHDRAGLRLFGL